MNPHIKVTEQDNNIWYAEYMNPAEKLFNRLGQYGKTEFEARLNLEALINRLKQESLKTKPDHILINESTRKI